MTGQSRGDVVIATKFGAMITTSGNIRLIGSMRPLPGLSLVQPSSGWAPYFSARSARDAWRALLLQSWLGVPLLFLLVLRFAARRIDRSWHDRPPSLRRENWV